MGHNYGLLFQMMHAKTEAEFQKAQEEFFGDENSECSDNEDFVDPCRRYQTRVHQFLGRGDEWLTIRRQNSLIRGNDTNNFSEATVRILKDVILQRTKAYNVVALVDFCSSVFEDYFKKRLLSLSFSRRADPRLQYAELCRKMASIETECATVLDEFHYLVPSQSSKKPVMYTVDAEYGLCACLSGHSGAFCKHQAFVHERFNIPFQNASATTADDRYNLAILALGDKCPQMDFFGNLRDVCDTPFSSGPEVF